MNIAHIVFSCKWLKHHKIIAFNDYTSETFSYTSIEQIGYSEPVNNT